MNYVLLSILLSSCAFFCSTVQSRQQRPRAPLRFQGMFKEYDNRRLDLIAQFIPRNPIIFEAGGHYGEDTIKFAAQWPDSKIISFEPNPNAFKKLLQTTANLRNIAGYNLAVNNYNGTADFYICHEHIKKVEEREGASSLLQPSKEMETAYEGPKIKVPCVILDDWCKNNGIDHIDFMWLDLEGVELQILKASPSILSTVKIIYTETNFFKYRIGTAQFPDLKNFLETSGFRLLSHWYREGKQGNAIFLKKELFDALSGIAQKNN